MILGFVEHDGGEPLESSLEMLTLARELAEAGDGALEVTTIDPEASLAEDELGAYGVDRVHRVTHADLDRFAPDAWAASIVQLTREFEPRGVLVPGTDRGQDVLARVGVKLELPMAANCIAVEPGDSWEVTRHRWGGSLIEHAQLEAPTKLLSVAPHELPIDAPGEAGGVAVNEFEPTLEEPDTLVKVDHVEESDVEGVPLGEARVVVGGGRGVGGPDGYDQLEELADLLGGAVGASRAAVNEGWRPHDDQIGLTGAKISPDIYIACGISGAVQHMVGCKGADTILAINTDAEAAIMQKGDYAVIGDLHEVVPVLNDAIRDRQ